MPLIIWGYSLTSHSTVVAQTQLLVLRDPEMLKGTAGFLLLLATGILSARAARRRMSYETWHYLHFATYLAIYPTFGHQLANGADFVGNRAAQLAWYAVYLTTAAPLLQYRFLVPVRRALRHRLRVTEVRPEAPGVVSVYPTGHRLDELAVAPGQFFRWRFLAPGMWWAANPYSLSAPARPDRLRITVKAAGTHSEALAAAHSTGRDSLLIGGGVGIAPLRGLFETLPVETAIPWQQGGTTINGVPSKPYSRP